MGKFEQKKMEAVCNLVHACQTGWGEGGFTAATSEESTRLLLAEFSGREVYSLM